MEGSFPSEFLLLGVVNHLCVAIHFTLVQKNLDDYYNTLSFISLVGMYMHSLRIMMIQLCKRWAGSCTRQDLVTNWQSRRWWTVGGSLAFAWSITPPCLWWQLLWSLWRWWCRKVYKDKRVTSVRNGRESHKACFVDTSMAEKPIIVYLSVSCYCDCDEEDRT